MDYTKNYHLPQWVKSDRIMMDDFNRMCADLENGLTGNRAEFRQKDSELSGRIEQVAGDARAQLQAADPASQASLKTGLLRLAYNHCHLLAAVEKQPPQSGCFFQQLKGSPTSSAINGLLMRSDALWIARGTASYTTEQIRSQIKLVSEMTVVKGNAAANTPMVVRFTPPGPVCIREFPFTNAFNDISSRMTTLHIALYNENTGEYEAEIDYPLDLGPHSGRTAFSILRVPLCFSGGFTYRIEISTSDCHYSGTGNYNPTRDPMIAKFTADSLTADTTGTISRTIPCGEARTDGIVLVHYRMIGTGGTLSLNWDGAVLTPVRTRELTNIDGKAVAEMEFRRNASVPATTSLQLNARCNPGGEIVLYGWGMAAV